MSQWGANAMAKNGDTYDNILKHYYNGVKIAEIIYT
jgi:stage II sporulation protein D